MNALDFLSSPVADALGWTLLHAVWQGFTLVLPIAILLHLLRDRSSALRYRIGTLTLLSQLLVSAITFMWYYKPLANTLVAKGAVTNVYALPIRWQAVAQTLPWHQQMQLFLENHLSQFVLIYLIGVALFGLRLAGGWIYLQRLTKTAIQPSTSVWMQLTERLRSTLSIRTMIQVRESSRIAVPMVVGMLKPVLLLPVALVTNLTTREIEAILAHELAHIKRHDYAVNLLQSVVEVLYFFHPALWWLSARIREEREHCCDDLAVQACGGDGRMLAQALARVEEMRLTHVNSAPTLAMALATNRQQLLYRVQRMLGVPSRPFISNGSLAGLTLATILLMSVSVYAVQNQDKPKHKVSRPRPTATRTHTIDSHSEYEMIDNQKISHIIWKGHKLPAARVQKLQRKLDQVMAGQLSLDDVSQPDRDILLTIIEKNNAFEQGMGALANGLSHIDYSNIVASALSDVPLSPDGTVEGLAKINYNNIIKDAFASLTPSKSLPDSLDNFNQLNHRQFDNDTLPKQFQNKFLELKLKYDQLHSQLTAYEKAMESYIANMRKPSNQRQHMYLEQRKLQEEIAYMRKQTSRADFRAITDALLAEIATAERNLSEARKRMEELTSREIHPYSDSLSKAFKQLTRLRDSIRINEGELINLPPVAPLPPAEPAAPLIGAPAPPPGPAAPAAKALRSRAGVTPPVAPKTRLAPALPKVERPD